ncbi:MAG: hypothetical protein WD399_09125 [Thermoleophilaceae bacterium]
MAAGDYVAIYAAVVATGALGWNVAQAVRARRDDVAVNIRWAWGDDGSGRDKDLLAITVLNRGHVPVGLGSTVGLARKPGGDAVFGTTAHDLPPVVPPGNGAVTRFSRGMAETAGLDLKQPLAAWVELATGDRVYSEPTRIRDVFERPD